MYNGGLLSQVKKDGPDAYVLNITYDSAGRPLTVENGYELCYYVTNLQGDVIGIRNTEEQLVTTYTYDAWGNFYVNGSSLIGDVNPLLYRGYVYDYETGMYYLQSRYYNPRWGRFINADAYATTGQGFVGNNMFVYCLNNPVCYLDSDGYIAIWWLLKLLFDWGFVHLCVQLDILVKYPSIAIEVTLPNNKRADIIDTKNGYVWEVKHGDHNVQNAKGQLDRYVNQTPKGYDFALKPGPANYFNGTFTIDLFLIYFEVTYKTPEEGVVIYYVTHSLPNLVGKPDYIYKEIRKEKEAPQVVMLIPNQKYVAAGFGICAFGFSFGGAYKPVGTQLRDAFY